MKTVQVYDKPMCCSTGICGPDVDPVLPQFAADLDWLKGQGHQRRAIQPGPATPSLH
jgi:arsenite methyltransferase